MVADTEPRDILAGGQAGSRVGLRHPDKRAPCPSNTCYTSQHTPRARKLAELATNSFLSDKAGRIICEEGPETRCRINKFNTSMTYPPRRLFNDVVSTVRVIKHQMKASGRNFARGHRDLFQRTVVAFTCRQCSLKATRPRSN